MKTLFNIEYIWDYYNKTKPINIFEGCINKFTFIKWSYENENYKILRNDKNFAEYSFVSQNFIIVLYNWKEKCSPTFHYPNNLVVYNLKKEIIKIIEPPKPKIERYKDLPFTQFWLFENIDNIKHLGIVVGEWDDEEVTHSEIRYLNLETLEFHPTIYEIRDTFGRNKPVKYVKYGI